MTPGSARNSLGREKRPPASFYSSTRQMLVDFRPFLVLLVLGLILLGGAFFRFQSVDWDSGQHLHPDERFLTMVVTGIQWPAGLSQYFDSAQSPLNPYNRGFGSYPYGTFPLFLTKWIAQLVNMPEYNEVHLVGRVLSGLMDLISIVLIFFLGRQLYGDRTGLLAAALLAFSVFNIQQAHFFTVDMPANLMVVITMLFAIQVARGGHWANLIGLGVAFGLAVASKLNLGLFGLVIVIACAFRFLGPLLASPVFQSPSSDKVPAFTEERKDKSKFPSKRTARKSQAPSKDRRRGPVGPDPAGPEHTVAENHMALNSLSFWLTARKMFLALASVLLLAFLVFRIAQPYAFSGPGVFDLRLSAKWLEDMKAVSQLVSGQSDYPAGHQWAFRTPYLFPWINMVRWGLGWGLGLSSWIGLALATWELFARRKAKHLLVVVWILAAFFTLGGGFVLTMRYFLPIYPFLVLMAAYMLVRLWDLAKTWPGEGRRAPIYLAGAIMAAVVAVTFLWALAFTAIYRQPVSRVTASRWIYANVPPGATIGWEHWDDPLPLRVDGEDAAFYYTTVELPLYAEDTPEKLYGVPGEPGSGLLDKLDQVDWIFVSSARLYGSIPRLPMRFPMTTKYYQVLFNGELGFERVKTFNGFPNLFGLEINDQSAEEQFTVYDHPQVDLFHKSAAYSRERAEKLLGNVDWEGILRLTPLVAMRTQNGLMLTPTEKQVQRVGGTWSQIFNRAALVNQNDLAALLTWLLSLELISIAVLPIALLAFHSLSDRGYLLAKPLGLLLVSYLSWMAASVNLLPYTRMTVLLFLALVGVVGGLIWSLQPAGLAGFFKAHWRLILIEEIVFLAFLITFVLVRRANPDLWRPWTGGEKPMDFAYLNAVLKSTRFPPYDPWFAGGYLNYYYLGFVQIASLIKLSGIVPWIAYNLAVPTIFAMTAAGAFSVVYNLTQAGERPAVFSRGVVYGLCGALFVAVLGNLGELRLIYKGLRELGSLSYTTGFVWLDGIRQVLSGLPLWLEGKDLPVQLDWWYWNATRIIPGNEIEEFPFFTFLFGDLHAHMMALPVTLLAIGSAVNLLRLPNRQFIPRSINKAEVILPVLSLSVLALVVGALQTINTWDYPTYLLISLSALALWGFKQHRGLDLQGAWIGMVGFALILRFSFGLGSEISLVLGILIGGLYGLAAGRQAALASAILALASLLLFFPFGRSYASAYSSAELWKGARTNIVDYLTIHGLFLFILATYLAIEWVSWLKTMTSRRPKAGEIGSRTIVAWLLSRDGLAFLSIGGISAAAVLGLFVFKLPVAIIVLPLATMSGLLLLRPGLEINRRFVFLLTLAGLLLTMLVEIVVLKGDVGRSNTVFKFYLQVWVLWGVAAAVSLPWVFASLRHGFRIFHWLWMAGLAVLVLAAALYPVFATRAHIEDRLEANVPKTLNGMSFMERGVYMDTDYAGQPVPIELKYDRDALIWMQDHITGSPVIAEANSPNLYHWTGRVSIWTGLPTLLGYNWHQKQQRAILGSEVVDRREQEANQLFLTGSSTDALALIRRLEVDYIYVGPLERAFYPPAGIDKFEQLIGQGLEVAYENPEVRIYRVSLAAE